MIRKMNPKQFLKLILIFNFIYLYNLSSAQNNPKYNGLDLIKYEGVPYYVNGLNIPWNYFWWRFWKPRRLGFFV